MPTYLEYQLEDGSPLLIQVDEATSGISRASLSDAAGNVMQKAGQSFESALAGVKSAALALRHHLADLQADEVEVTFGLKATGDLGNFAIGKVGAEANYTVTLKWSHQKSEPPNTPINF